MTALTDFKIDPETGLLAGVRFCESPNQDERPEGVVPEVLVIHAISLPPGRYGGPYVQDLFLNQLDTEVDAYFQEICQLQVSAHLFVRRDGEVVQFVPLQRRAWHAGVSCCEGRERVNDFSIGIELEGDDHSPFEPVQYEVLAGLTRAIRGFYPAIGADRVYGHSDIAPGRKTDPGPCFDWSRYRKLIV